MKKITDQDAYDSDESPKTITALSAKLQAKQQGLILNKKELEDLKCQSLHFYNTFNQSKGLAEKELESTVQKIHDLENKKLILTKKNSIAEQIIQQQIEKKENLQSQISFSAETIAQIKKKLQTTQKIASPLEDEINTLTQKIRLLSETSLMIQAHQKIQLEKEPQHQKRIKRLQFGLEQAKIKYKANKKIEKDHVITKQNELDFLLALQKTIQSEKENATQEAQKKTQSLKNKMIQLQATHTLLALQHTQLLHSYKQNQATIIELQKKSTLVNNYNDMRTATLKSDFESFQKIFHILIEQLKLPKSALFLHPPTPEALLLKTKSQAVEFIKIVDFTSGTAKPCGPYPK